jgi:hypothetical protein
MYDHFSYEKAYNMNFLDILVLLHKQSTHNRHSVAQSAVEI